MQLSGSEYVGMDQGMTDFEVGIINAAKAVFPDASLRCCFFHLGQSTYRHVQSCGLQVEYNDPNDRSVKEGVHMMLSLAFVHPADVQQALEVVQREVPASLEPATTYFNGTDVRGLPAARGRQRQRREPQQRCPPRYQIELWNAYDATLRDEHRTNNASEGWHLRFQVGCTRSRGIAVANTPRHHQQSL